MEHRTRNILVAGLLATILISSFVLYDAASARPISERYIMLEGEITVDSPIMMAGLPLRGFGCRKVYWQRGRPQYQNRVSSVEFTVPVSGNYRILMSNGFRELTEEEIATAEVEDIDIENAIPRPYVMLYNRRFDIKQPTSRCIWAGRDEDVLNALTFLRAGKPYIFVVSYEGDKPEWAFPYRLFLERIEHDGYHFCISENDPACAE